MKKSSLSEQVCVLGGYSESECKAVQAMAASLVSDGTEPESPLWDEWLELYDKYCA